MQQFSVNPTELVRSVWQNRGLIKTLIQREILGRYRGSIVGIFWSFLNPIFMLLVYTFVFSVVFKSRWPGGGESKAEFALILFAGLIVFNFFAECINKAPTLILTNSNYVKKVVFPLEILPWVSIGAALFHSAASLFVWFAAYVVFIGLPNPTIVMFPIVCVPLMVATVGVCWWLASLGVYLRDAAQIVSLVTTVLMFMSPVFYPVSALPKEYAGFINLNPLTIIIEQARDVLIWNRWPDPLAVLLSFAVSALIAWLGFAWFQKTRRGFADVL
jgi:lipopolysaccharide transport system permease protein